MKRISHYILPLVLLFFIGCQEEIDETITDNEEDRITQGALVTSLIQNVVTMDGSFDNIIDGASCISVELPVEVTVNNVDLTIENENDFQVIEAILEQSAADEDEFSITFPITIIHADYTETEITSQEALDQFVIGCGGENAVDDDIENVDFVYPINISLFDANNNLLETVTVSSDEQLFQLLDTLTENDIADFVYPITMSLLDGTFVSMNSLVELQSFLNANSNADFDEDDDNDFDDDDNTEDLGATEFEALLAECPLQINRVFRNGETIRYDRYVFYFATGGNVSIVIEDRQITGSYETASDDNGILITFSLGEELVQLNDTWRVHRIIEDDPATIEEEPVQIDLRIGQDELLYEQDCAELDFNEVLVRNALMTCFWRGVPNGNDGFNEYEFYFNENNELIILNSINGNVLDGTYEVTEVNGGVVVTIDANEPLDDFDGSWNVTDFEENRIEFEDGSNTLVLEQECEDDTMLCFEESLAFEICDEDDNPNDGSTTFNLNDFCENEAYTFYETELDAQTETNQISGEYTNVVSPQTLYVRYDIPNSSNVEIFTIDVIVENCNPEAQIALVKTGTFQDTNGNSAVDVGDTITYTFTLINGGDVTLENVTITDPLINAGTPIAGPDAGDTNNDGILDLVETWIYTATYLIIQDDIDAGQVTNQATARGETVGGNAVEDLSDDDNSFEDDPTVTPLNQEPAIALIKTAVFNDENNNDFAEEGESVTYTFIASNLGNVTLENIIVNDATINMTHAPTTPNVIEPGEDAILTFEYIITPGDITNGSINNQATVEAEALNGDTVEDFSDNDSPLEDDPTITPLPSNNTSTAIALIKQGEYEDVDLTRDVTPGDRINYTFTVTNEGAAPLNNIEITDPIINGGAPIPGPDSGDSNNDGILDTDETWIYTASYFVTNQDISTGSIENQAQAKAEGPAGDPNDSSDDVIDFSDDDSPLEDDPTITPLPGIAIVKTGEYEDSDNSGTVNPGDSINYAFMVTNSGQAPLTNIIVFDFLIDGGNPIPGPDSGDSNNDGILDTDETWFYSATYAISAQDISEGFVSNQATASGEVENGAMISDDSDDDSPFEDDPTVTEFPQSMGILTGLVFEDANANGIQDPGENGIAGVDVLITDVNGMMQTVTTDANGNWTAMVLAGDTDVDVDEDTLPSQDWQLTTIGSDPETITVVEDITTSTRADGYIIHGVITGVVFEDLNDNGIQDAGESGIPGADVQIEESNGNMQTVITDSDGNWTAVVQSGETTIDVDETTFPNGGENYVLVTEGSDPETINVEAGTSISTQDDGYQIIEAEPNLDFEKTASEIQDTNANGFTDPGDTITYSFSVTNNGNVTVNNISIDDAQLGITQLVIAPSNLEPNETGTATADYVITASDIANGSVVNQAIVTGTPIGANGDNLPEISKDSDDPSTSEPNDPTITIVPNDAAYFSGTVFEDINGDGVQNNDEQGLGNVDINLSTDGNQSITVTTFSNGNWEAFVMPGEITINVDETTLPNGGDDYVLTTANSDPETFNVQAGSFTQTQDDGYSIARGSLTGFVFDDVDGDGAYNPNGDSLFSAGVEVDITDEDGNITTVITDANGNWMATLPIGDYTVDVQENTIPPGYVLTTSGSDPELVTVVADIITATTDDGYRMN